jgi:hypothetical protein
MELRYNCGCCERNIIVHSIFPALFMGLPICHHCWNEHSEEDLQFIIEEKILVNL